MLSQDSDNDDDDQEGQLFTDELQLPKRAKLKTLDVGILYIQCEEFVTLLAAMQGEQQIPFKIISSSC